jgi:hypothetical protein
MTHDYSRAEAVDGFRECIELFMSARVLTGDEFVQRVAAISPERHVSLIMELAHAGMALAEMVAGTDDSGQLTPEFLMQALSQRLEEAAGGA